MREKISVCGMELGYAVIGDGEKPFVMIPGLSVKSVLPMEEAIADMYKPVTEKCRIYLFDVPFSIGEDYRLTDYADEIAAAMQSLGIAGATVFGASMGGMVAELLAIRHPDVVGRLALASTMCRNSGKSYSNFARWNDLAKYGMAEDLAESILDHCYSKATLMQYRDVMLAANADITKEELHRIEVLTKDMLTLDCFEELPKITCPTLVIGSEIDNVLGADGSYEIADIVGAELFMYDDERYGHAVYDEAPDFTKRIAEFCL